MMRLLFAFILGVSIASCNGDYPESADLFDGTWKLDRYEVYDSLHDSWISDSARIGYSGFIQYDGTGHMSVQILPTDYNSKLVFNEEYDLSLEEMQSVASYYHSNFVYFARCRVIGDTIEHTILSCTESANVGKILLRKFEFKSDTLWLTPVSTGQKVSRLKWVKLSQN